MDHKKEQASFMGICTEEMYTREALRIFSSFVLIMEGFVRRDLCSRLGLNTLACPDKKTYKLTWYTKFSAYV